ncbi:efflux RND transporter periplasmic adaptor subunit [Lysobacter sp. GX 14042]|uniref:efflux RND transporter periplasmic adaptor subunit n=1 Tax=Lysobacter sp. GX 14042 TaxID=2907155 RepID=UPI001F3E7AC6|nr:efflux RND transporter periplasmic adaptor subunit [Lysobacter sp. GX 14042]MCE7033402.1 efflux RND transporter periplasmic adaptor subunit [Lysobacter sp. GX 14042]
MRAAVPSRVLLHRCAIALLACVLVSGCGGREEAPEAPRTVLVTRVGAHAGTGTSLAGEIRARHETQLGFQVAGRMVERQAEVGDRVERGELLARLEPDDLQARERAARAQLAAAEAELGRARADQARFRVLAEDQLVSRSTLDTQNAAATAAQGQVDAARAELELARNQAGHTRLLSPADGVIAALHAETGQVLGAGQPVFTLATDGDREVVFAVAEGQVGHIRPGDPVQVEPWTGEGGRLNASVREVAPAADPTTRTYQVRATIDAPPGALELGQSARVFLPDGGADTLSVPLAALQPNPEGGKAVFVLAADSTVALRPVQAGAYAADGVAVMEGLRAGEWVVAAGGHLLREGMAVRPVDAEGRSVAPGDGTP